jgi:hypothetical protein
MLLIRLLNIHHFLHLYSSMNLLLLFRMQRLSVALLQTLQVVPVEL